MKSHKAQRILLILLPLLGLLFGTGLGLALDNWPLGAILGVTAGVIFAGLALRKS